MKLNVNPKHRIFLQPKDSAKFLFNIIQKYSIEFILISIILIGFILRASFSKTGLPYFYVTDAVHTFIPAIKMLKTGDFHPRAFNYGSLNIYLNLIVDFLHYISLMGKPETAEAFLTHIDDLIIGSKSIGIKTPWPWHISHPSFLHWGRLFTAVLGCGTVIVTYVLGRYLCNRWIGLMAAASIAFLGSHIQMSAKILPDVPVGLFFISATAFSIAFIRNNNRAYFFLALIFCGAAAATKINGGLVVIAPIMTLAYLQLRREACVRPYDWFWIFLIPTIAFIAFMPYSVIDFTEFMKNFGRHIRIYKVTYSGANALEPGWENFVFQISLLKQRFGLLPLLLTLPGIIYILRSPIRIVAFAPAVLYLLFLVGARTGFYRNLVLLYPFVALLSSFGVYVLYRALKNWQNYVPLKFSAWKQHLPQFATVVALLAIVPNATSAIDIAAKQYGRHDNRTLASIELGAHARQKKVPQIIIAAELRFHAHDLKRIGVPYRVVSMTDIQSCKIPHKRSLLVVPERLKVIHSKNKKTLKKMVTGHGQLMKMLKKGGTISKYRGATTLIDTLFKNPAIVIVDINVSAIC